MAMKHLINVLGLVAAVASGAGSANAGELRDACEGIKAKSPDAVGRADALLACVEKLAIEVEARPIIPRGAVVAFDQKCPEPDWKLFDRAGGRFVVGAGHHANSDMGGNQLTIYKKQFLNGGEERHTLTEQEIPSHSHALHRTPDNRQSGRDRSAAFPPLSGNYPGNEKTGSAGAGGSHNNMPPYIALYYCIKK